MVAARVHVGAARRSSAIGIEPREGGHCSEHGPHGFRCDWGRVVTCEPPGADRVHVADQRAARAAAGPGAGEPRRGPLRAGRRRDARHRSSHRHFSRHGEGADAYEAAMSSPQGWPLLLERFAAACAGNAGPGGQAPERVFAQGRNPRELGARPGDPGPRRDPERARRARGTRRRPRRASPRPRRRRRRRRCATAVAKRLEHDAASATSRRASGSRSGSRAARRGAR